ncbi:MULTISPECIES: hypothetical protein [Paenibacillus]|uniref:STAS/SEC14 domain-containing protein n=1 Tax=Paenibacillus agri TaxID=2744309 RepID=A0A850EI49_9BACL|nr:hypothetical protein [Paenibacillus agri]NUU59369.1 hypothetical protein [Paenibacillus agri]
MFTIEYNAAKNRVVVTAQEVTLDNAQQYIDEFTEILKKVKPGFTGVTILTGAKVLSQEVAKELAPTSELATQKGVSTDKKWAYVTGSSIYKMQMRRIFGDFVEYFETVEQADAYLSN